MKLLPLNYLWGPTLGSLTSRYETSYKSEKPDNWHFRSASSPFSSIMCTAPRYSQLHFRSVIFLQSPSSQIDLPEKRSKHRKSGRIPSLIGSLTPAHGRLSRNKIINFCKRIISHPVKSQYLKYLKKRDALSMDIATTSCNLWVWVSDDVFEGKLTMNMTFWNDMIG